MRLWSLALATVLATGCFEVVPSIPDSEAEAEAEDGVEDDGSWEDDSELGEDEPWEDDGELGEDEGPFEGECGNLESRAVELEEWLGILHEEAADTDDPALWEEIARVEQELMEVHEQLRLCLECMEIGEGIEALERLLHDLFAELEVAHDSGDLDWAAALEEEIHRVEEELGWMHARAEECETAEEPWPEECEHLAAHAGELELWLHDLYVELDLAIEAEDWAHVELVWDMIEDVRLELDAVHEMLAAEC